MGINQLVDAYKGNPQPLQARVQQAQKNQPPGAIPPDLEEAIALQKISELRNSAQNQQAMQAGGAQPSVVEKLRQMLGAEQRQQGQPPEMPQGMPQGQSQMPPQMPQGQPPVMAARGGSISQLMSNLGRHYAGGGIVAFTNGGDIPSSGELSGFGGPTPEQEAEAEVRAAEQARIKQLIALEQKVAFLKSAGAPQAREAQMQLNALKSGAQQKPSPTDPNFRRQPDPRLTGTPATAPDVPIITSAPTAPRATTQSANVGGGGGSSGSKQASLIDELVKQGLITKPGSDPAYKKMAGVMNMDADTEETKAINKFKQQVGEKDLSIYDQMAQELKARKERLNAPKPGFDSLMEYLGQIAQSGGGRNWMESGAKGAAGLSALQKSRQDQQDVLVDKIMDLGAKKKEAEYTQKEKMYDIGQARYKEVFKNAFEAAKEVNKSDDEARKIAIEAVLKQKELDNRIQTARMGSRDNLAERAAKIRAENTGMSYEESIRRAALAGGATSVEGTNARTSKAYIDAKNKIDERFQHLISDTPYGKKQKELYEKAIADLNEAFGVSGGGGINTLPSAAKPIPTGAKPSDLNIGTIYQTARGPARWNGKTFDPVQ